MAQTTRREQWRIGLAATCIKSKPDVHLWQSHWAAKCGEYGINARDHIFLGCHGAWIVSTIAWHWHDTPLIRDSLWMNSGDTMTALGLLAVLTPHVRKRSVTRDIHW